jgi:hypothetical protein
VNKKFQIIAVTFLAIQLFAAATYASEITNGDFENGLTGWSYGSLANGAVTVVQSTSGTTGSMAQLKATSSLWQSFSWQAGDTLTFDYSFLGLEKRRFKVDIATYYVASSSQANPTPSILDLLHLVDAEILGTTTTSDKGWQEYSYTFQYSGQGLIQFSSINLTDEAFDSILLLDNIKQTSASPVPIPGSALLLGSSLLGLVGIGSRKKKGNAN